MVTYAEAIATQDSNEIQTETIEALADAGVVVTGWSATSAERGLIALDSRARAAEQDIRAEVVKAILLVDPDARDAEWLDRVIEGYFRVPRLRATKAKHLFLLTNQSTTGGPYVIEANREKEASTLDGVKFRNITGGTLNAGVGEELRLEFEAVVAGVAGNIGPGEVYKLTSGAIPGADITNEVDSQTFVARDDETNSAYVNRALARWGTLAAGGHDLAVEYRILTGVETITKVGFDDANPTGQSSVDVFLANSTGAATNDECEAAEEVFGPYEPLGSRGRWRYLPAVENVVVVSATLELDGSNENTLDDAERALEALQAQWPMRAGLVLDSTLVGGILRGMASEEYNLPGFRGVKNVTMPSPSADVTLAANEVLVFDITLTAA